MTNDDERFLSSQRVKRHQKEAHLIDGEHKWVETAKLGAIKKGLAYKL